MCMSAPKVDIPKTPPPTQFQAMQSPKDFINPESRNKDKMRRRGLWASIFTSPSGLKAAPIVTGSVGGTTGG